jgi:hypothetical protein
MKNRNTILIAILSALACFALLPKAQAAPETALPNFNTADGQNALANVTTGAANTAVGWFSLFSDADGSFNSGLGAGTLLFNVSGNNNTAVGAAALLFSTGADNVAVGAAAGLSQDTGSNNIYIGDSGVAGESNVIAIGAVPSSGTNYTGAFVGGIFGADVPVGTAVPVYVGSDGKLGTNLVNANGNRATVPTRHGVQPQAMLNELQKQQKRIAELETTVAQQAKAMAEQRKATEVLTAQLKEQAAQIQKVSAQLELSKPAPRTVANK